MAGQRTGAGANFQNMVLRADLGGGGDAPEDPAVDEEMLAQCFARPGLRRPWSVCCRANILALLTSWY